MKQALIVMTSGIMLFSCKKDKNDTPQCEISMAGLSGSYKLTALQYKPDPAAQAQDFLAMMDDCEKDDILVLKSDGTYDYNDLGTVCDPTTEEHGTWLVNGKTLISDGRLNGTVASYDCKTLVYYIPNALKPGDKLTFTLVKQ